MRPHSRFQHLGVCNLPDVTAAASHGKAQALRFTNTEIRLHHVTLHQFRKLATARGHSGTTPPARRPSSSGDGRSRHSPALSWSSTRVLQRWRSSGRQLSSTSLPSARILHVADTETHSRCHGQSSLSTWLAPNRPICFDSTTSRNSTGHSASRLSAGRRRFGLRRASATSTRRTPSDETAGQAQHCGPSAIIGHPRLQTAGSGSSPWRRAKPRSQRDLGFFMSAGHLLFDFFGHAAFPPTRPCGLQVIVTVRHITSLRIGADFSESSSWPPLSSQPSHRLEA